MYFQGIQSGGAVEHHVVVFEINLAVCCKFRPHVPLTGSIAAVHGSFLTEASARLNRHVSFRDF